MKTIKRLIPKTLFILSLLWIVQACSTVPLIGRSQMNLLPESNLVQMSLTSYNDFLTQNKVSNNRCRGTKDIKDASFAQLIQIVCENKDHIRPFSTLDV